MRKYIFLMITMSLGLLNACDEENPLDTEQYIKQIYIVGANQSNNEGLLTVNVPYTASEEEEAETFISLAVSGSQYIDRDVTATVVEAGTATVDQYNFMYLYNDNDIQYRMLGAFYYRIPNSLVTIKANNVYGKVPIFLKTHSLERDSLYALTFKIASVSDPEYVKIRDTDTVLMFSFSLYNDYSGSYSMEGNYYQYGSTGTVDTVSVNVLRQLQATSYNSVRLFHLANTESVANATTYGIKITFNEDKTIDIQSWGGLTITDGGGSYNSANKKITLWYNYMVNGAAYQFIGTLTKGSD